MATGLTLQQNPHSGESTTNSLVAALQKAGFSGDVVTKSSPAYETGRRRYSALAEKFPALIVYPVTEEDVSTAIILAKKHEIPLAVRGGGNHASGASSVDDGLVIDLGCLQLRDIVYLRNANGNKKVLIEAEKRQVTISGGCRWNDVYTALHESKTGLLCVGGGVHVVGVGGHISGGGYGPLSPKYGMAIDNVVSLRIVLGNGEAVQASLTENSDLFWAVRGSSSQFGVITEFVLRLYPAPTTWIDATFVYPATAIPQLLELLNEYENVHRARDEICFPFLALSLSPNGARHPIAVVKWTAGGSKTEWDRHFKPFYDNQQGRVPKPLVNHIVDNLSIVDLSHSLDDVLLAGPRRIITAGIPCTALWEGMVERCHKELLSYIKEVGDDAATSKILFEMHGAARINPETSCYPIPVRHFSVVCSAEHTSHTNDAAAHAFTQRIAKIVRETERKNTGKDLFLQGNGCMREWDSKDIYGNSYSRLQRLKAKYDPSLLFNRWHLIQPSGTSECP